MTGADIRKADAGWEEEWYYSVGLQNYVFGLPLTILERERKLRLDRSSAVRRTSWLSMVPRTASFAQILTITSRRDLIP